MKMTIVVEIKRKDGKPITPHGLREAIAEAVQSGINELELEPVTAGRGAKQVEMPVTATVESYIIGK